MEKEFCIICSHRKRETVNTKELQKNNHNEHSKSSVRKNSEKSDSEKIWIKL